MKQLWSPWRMAYIERDKAEAECLFCARLREDDARGLILHRGRKAFVMLNRYPYTNGHMMIVPYEHSPTLEALDEATLTELMTLSSKGMVVLRAVYASEAFNVGMNIGEAAGAGVADHVHIHVVPRWAGDTNFMATTAETRVLPEALETTYSRLLAGWQKADQKI